MAFDEEIGKALDDHLLGWPDTSTRRMFGGVAYMVQGKMFAVLDERGVGMKLHSEQRSRALALDWVSPFSPTGGSFGLWVQFALSGPEAVPNTASWLRAAYDFVLSEPAPRKRKR
jgi:hypothetical protein